MSVCPNCGRDLPEGTVYCPDCGATAVDLSVAQPDISSSQFNSGFTTTTQPQVANPPIQAEETGFSAPVLSQPAEEKRSSSTGNRRIMIAIIAILAILLVGTTFESGLLGAVAAPAVNSESHPLTGGQLYAAYQANEAAYANKTVYVKDSLDFGVSRDFSNGEFYSYIDSGNVVLFWSTQSQLNTLTAGSTVLAQCSVAGQQVSPVEGDLLILQDCSVVSVGSQTSTTSSVSVSVAND